MEEDRNSYIMQLPVDRQVCAEVMKLLDDQSVSMNALEKILFKDPVLVLALLYEGQVSQALTSSKNGFSLKEALVSTGQSKIKSLIEELSESESCISDNFAMWVKIIKHKCLKAANTARIIAKRCSPALQAEAMTLGLLTYLPELHAISKLEENYTSLLEEEYGKAKLRYKLAKDHNFDFDAESRKFYKAVGLSDAVIALLDYDSSMREEELRMKKAMALSATEFLDAFLEERLENLAGDKPIPPKSARRMMALTKENYNELFQSVQDYLTSGKIEEYEPAEEETDEVCEEGHLASEAPSSAFVEREPEVAPPQVKKEEEKVTEQTLNKIIGLFEGAEEVQELLLSLLDMLINDGPFKRTALLVVSSEEKKAVPLLFRGKETEVITELEINNPLSPLLSGQSKVVSCSRKKSETSPFGSGSYAMAPLEVNYDNPVVLYADCGDGIVINFESRRLFRRAVTLLNQMLPDMDGTISAEVRNEELESA